MEWPPTARRLGSMRLFTVALLLLITWFNAAINCVARLAGKSSDEFVFIVTTTNPCEARRLPSEATELWVPVKPGHSAITP